MNVDKKKLKELLEQENHPIASNKEVEAIARVLSVLEKQDSTITLPANFSDSVVRRVIQKQVRENRFGWFGYFIGIIGLLIALVVSLALVDFKLDFGFLKNISGYSGLFLFGIAFIFLLNLIEKKVLRITSE